MVLALDKLFIDLLYLANKTNIDYSYNKFTIDIITNIAMYKINQALSVRQII